MTEHYYSAKPGVKSDLHTLEVTLKGKAYKFWTDTGVFSKSGIDFGSRLLIETAVIGNRDRVLDVGCGYGPIGLSAASAANEGEAVLLDVNERALELARENAKRNGLVNVRIIQSDALNKVLAERFDCILTNPPIRAGKEVVHRIFEQAYTCLQRDGKLWVVIQKKQGAPSAYVKIEQIFGNVKEVAKEKGYKILMATKTSEDSKFFE